MKIFKLIIVSSFALSMANISAQENEEQSAVEQPQNIERIEVKGRKPKRFYLDEFRKHQKSFVSMFNDLVSDPEMEVVCELESFTGTRVKKRNCQPRFMKTIAQEETQRELSRGSSFAEAANVEERGVTQQRLLKEYKKFQKLTAKLLNENPELASTYIKMENALTTYEEFEQD